MTHSSIAPLPFDETIKVIQAILEEQKLPSPLLGIVCGSGLSTLADKLSNTVRIPYSQLPGFGESTGTHFFTRWTRNQILG